MITPSFALTATERVLPKLALDFTTAVLDGRITLTRALNTATRFNSSGYIETVNADLPRFDFNPATLVCRGLLIEEACVNLNTYSNDFRNTATAGATRPWSWTRSTVTPDVVGVTSPDGTENASKLVEDTTETNTHLILNPVSGTTNTNPYTFTIFAKAGERPAINIQLQEGSPFARQAICTFNLTNGVSSVVSESGGAAGTSASMTLLSNGWYRCSVTTTLGGTAGSLREIVLLNNGTSTVFTGNGTDGAYIWGAQLEAGVFATSYIPTTSAALTRNADVASITGTNFSDWWQAGFGGATVQALPSTVSGVRPLIQFDDGTANEIIALRGNTTNPELYIVDGGTPQAQIDAGTIAANTAYNLGAAWDTDNCAAAVNGGAAVIDTSATIPTATQARLGSDGTNYLNGHLQTVRYWPQRIINTEVQAFSK